MPTPKRNNGFTLLEVLIALFIFTFISVIMVNALHITFSSQTATEKSAARLAQLQIAILLIGRDIQQTIDRPIVNYAGKPEASFIGAPTTLTLTHAGLSNPLGQLQRATLQRTRYGVANAVLLRESWSALDQAATSASQSRALFSPASGLLFSYLDSKGTFQPFWPPTNQQEKGLPRAVSVTLTLPQWGSLTQLFIIPGQSLAPDAKP